MEPDRTTPFVGAKELIAAGLVLGATLTALAWWIARPAPRNQKLALALGPVKRPGDRFLGPQACRECHVSEYTLFAKSGHSRTFRRADERSLARWLTSQTVEDPERPGVTWTYELRDGKLRCIRDDGRRRDEQVIEYAFGSGRHATTFLTMLPGDSVRPQVREHRLTYFAHRDRLGITPGQEGYDPASGTHPHGRDITPEFTHLCFACHTTITSADNLERLDPATLIPSVTCERCHGPGREHVLGALAEGDQLRMPYGRKGAPPGWDALSQMRLCGGCHRHPDMVEPDRIRRNDPELVRFQPVGLMQSLCFTRSDGRMHCLTCHDPHAPVETRTEVYEARCLECHSGARGQPTCPVNASRGCVDCHMPRKDAGQGVLFTDHWIRVQDEAPSEVSGPAVSPSDSSTAVSKH